MRNISAMLARGNLTPRERYVLLIQSDIHRMKTGKEFLTEADKAALVNWKAKTNEEAHEWNRLNDAWRHTGRMSLEAEFYYNDAQIAHLQMKPIMMELVLYPFRRDMRKMLKNMDGMRKVDAKQALSIMEKQRAAKLKDGMDFEYAVYNFAFEHLGEADRKRLVELYEDIEFDHQYLDEEEIIAHVLGGKETLDASGKEKLASLIAERCYNRFAKEYQLFHYFACIPLSEAARHFLASKGIPVSGKKLAKDQMVDDEDTCTHRDIEKAAKSYAAAHDVTVETVLKEGFIGWYDEKGFEYTPLVVSDDKELFERWLAAKAEARSELMRLVGSGALRIEARAPEEAQRYKEYRKDLIQGELDSAIRALEMNGASKEKQRLFERFNDMTLAGESLYGFVGDFTFVKDFKKRVDEYEPNLGIVYAEDDIEHKGEHLDGELLICDLDEHGEPSVVSPYGLSFMRFEASFDAVAFLAEEERDGKRFLTFSGAKIEKVFRGSRESFIEAYGKLLAINEVLHKLVPTYECEVAYRTTILLAALDGYIESHNDALRKATQPLKFSDYEESDENVDAKDVLEVDQSLYIDKSAIVPDASVIEEHTAKLKEILGAF